VNYHCWSNVLRGDGSFPIGTNSRPSGTRSNCGCLEVHEYRTRYGQGQRQIPWTQLPHGIVRTGVGNNNFLLLGLLLLCLLTPFLFLDLLHSLLRSRRFHHIGPHRNCRGWGPCRGRLFATGLNLRSRKTPGSGCRDRRIFCGRADISDGSSCTLTFESNLPRFGLFGFSFLNFAEPNRYTRRLLPIVVLGPNSLDSWGMNR
jgi:hypothetical protein